MNAISSVSNDRSIQPIDLWDSDGPDQDDDASQSGAALQAMPPAQFSLANFATDETMHPIVNGTDACSASCRTDDASQALLDQAQQVQGDNEDLAAQAQTSQAGDKSNLLNTLLSDILNMLTSANGSDPAQDALQDPTQNTAPNLQ